MAITGFRKTERGERHASRPRPEEGRATTYLDQGCELSGELRFKETVQIDGRVEGEIESQQTVVIGESAMVRATIRSDSVIVRGQVEGDVLARRKITLHKSAHVTGDMKTAGIVVEEGAKVEGRIVIGSDEKAPVLELNPPPEKVEPPPA